MNDAPPSQLSRIDTNVDLTINVYDDPWDPQPSTSQRVSIEPLSYRFSSSPTSHILETTHTSSASTNHVPANVNSRARTEARKLLSHVLLQLASRKRPESIIDSINRSTNESAGKGFGALAESLKEAVKRKGSVSVAEDSDEETDHLFTTDETIDLLLKLESVLTMSDAQGWKIFDDDSSRTAQDPFGSTEKEAKMSSPFRRSRSGGRRSRSSSPSAPQIQVPELLTLCISVLKSIVSEDCRYRVTAPRPSRPPNTLQGLTLNIAQFLIHHQHHNPRIISQIAFAMIPAFSTFPPQMFARLLAFFETSIVRTVLQTLERVQGTPSNTKLSRPESGYGDSSPSDDLVVSIQIDEVPNETPGPESRTWAFGSPVRDGIPSTNNPYQSPHIYYLAFLIPPLLSAMLDNLGDLGQTDTEVSLSFVSLLKLISNSKLDTYNDLLEIVAYRGSKARRLAITALGALWPKPIGHTVISSPFYLPENERNLSPRASSYMHDHHFAPWYFPFNRNRVHVGQALHDDCRTCLKPILGFGLFCSFCMTATHFDCYDYPTGNYDLQYSIAHDIRLQRIAMFRFSNLKGKGEHGNLSEVSSRSQHRFTAANWFTLCLCLKCKQPLWGLFNQGIKCGDCNVSLHTTCAESLDYSDRCTTAKITSQDIQIDWEDLRRSCLDYYPFLDSPVNQLESYSYEEISIFRDVLKTQLQLLTNGIEYGSLVVLQDQNIAVNIVDKRLKEFELHQTMRHCEDLLNSNRLPYAQSTTQYLQETQTDNKKFDVLFTWSYLEYVTATIKVPRPQNNRPVRPVSDLLGVAPIEVDNTDHDEVPAYPVEAMPLVHIRHMLAECFGLRSEFAARCLINHLHHLSFIERVNHNPLSFEDIALEKEELCTFPLPLGLDLSVNVEILVSAVESSLADLNLTSNEFGFLLLTRRFWPTGLASESALKRLSARVLSWILDEDDNLAIILREYVAKQQPLPGVRNSRHPQTWPSSSDNRPTANSLASNGGDYVAARRSLLSRFALPWLYELHNLQPDFYCEVLFETCLQAAEEIDSSGLELALPGDAAEKSSKLCDDILRSIIKLSQSSVVFSVFDDLFIRWLEFIHEANQNTKPIPSLSRFPGQDGELTRTSIAQDTNGESTNLSSALYADPLRAISNFASQSQHGLSRTLSFLSNVVKSGINIPIATFRHFLRLIVKSDVDSLQNADMFVRALLLAVWLRSSGREDLQSLISSFHAHFSNKIVKSLASGEHALLSLSIIRQSLAACLRIYGCDRTSIINAGLVFPEEVNDLPSRRKLAVRTSGVVDPIIIEPGILNSLQQYMETGVEQVPCMVAKFINMFVLESPFLESFEVDNFILRNGKIISTCVWIAYNIQQQDIALVRTNLLLRSLLVDSEHFHDIIPGCLASTNPLEIRLSAINKLFRMITDVSSPAFDVEGRQWRSSVIDIFFWFFSALWSDPSEEVRLAVRSFSASLLPGHFEVISQCWNEALTKATIAERTRLVGFLIQIRPYFPKWKVLSWDHIIDTLMEYDLEMRANVAHDAEKNAFRLSTTDPDLAHLRVSIILLSLQMIADGIEIDHISIMRLKIQFVQICGFNDVSAHPTQNGQSFHLRFTDITQLSESAYSCIEELAHVVDAPYYARLPYEALGIPDVLEDKLVNVLVGTTFLDVALYMLSTLRDLSSLPVLTLKCILETLYITLHKYDFEDRLLYHLQPLFRRATLRAVNLLSKDISYEIRQLALSIAQASINKWHSILSANVSTILELVADEIALETKYSQDSLVVHGKILIGNTLNLFCNHGLLLSLFKRKHPPEFFNVLGQVFQAQWKDPSFTAQVLCDALLRDTFARAVECDPISFQAVVQNLSTFIEMVFSKDYSFELIIFIGQQLTQLVRRMSDGTIERADPSPLIVIFTVLLQNHKRFSNASELMAYADTVVRVALNRLHVSSSCLTRLITVTQSLRPKNQEVTPGSIDMTGVLFDILQDGFLMKTKISPLTMKSLIESLTSSEDENSLPPSSTHAQVFRNMLEAAYNYMQNHAWQEENTEDDFQAAMCTGKFILQIANQDPSVLQKIMDPTSEKFRGLLSIRSWNILVLSTLEAGHDDWISMMFSYFPTFCATFSALLRSYVQSGISSALAATTDVNQTHIAMKLWLMVADFMCKLTKGGDTMIASVWAELWAAYDGFLHVLEIEAQARMNPTLITLASTSTADLLIFIHSLKNALALDTSSHIAILNRLRALNKGDSASTRAVNRALRLMMEPPSDPINLDLFFDQTAKELLAAEKLRMMNATRDNRIAGDRYRKEGKILMV
ncbi:hypothetical protein D9613_003079 [Agrocybe pediades]|uniref:Phorbol-ester/DAG-type domain-containing protein n=1 Tax=Agrocybe pediades TaxID=84607 RepID=A0A8H4VLP9_9AGAR|nr:hypothetical protein D9613_003079 [Agrocybe pediades]